MRKIIVTLALGLPVLAFAAADAERRFELSVPLDGIERVSMQAQVGEVNIVAADVDAIAIEVILETENSSAKVAERMERAKLVHEIDDGELSVKLDYSRSMLSDNDLEERWQVRMPAALALDADLNIGAMRIEGVSGGVTADVNIGDLNITVPEGDVEADLNIGSITIRNATRSLGSVELGTTIGDVSLQVDGKPAGKATGWLGAKMVHDEDGDDDIDASVNIGEVTVRIR